MCEDKRSASLDAGNVKLTYNALQEKAESKDKEKAKEETKRLRKLEGELRAVFTELGVEEEANWVEVRGRVAEREAYMAVTEGQAEKMFRWVLVPYRAGLLKHYLVWAFLRGE